MAGETRHFPEDAYFTVISAQGKGRAHRYPRFAA